MVVRSRDTSGPPCKGPAPLSSTRRFDSESPIRWPVRPHSGDTGFCGSERGEFEEHGRPASSNEDGSACRLLEDAPRAQAEIGAEASQRHPLFREPSLTPQLCGAPGSRAHSARARGTATRTRDEDHRRSQARSAATRSAPAGECTAQDRDLPCLRQPLLRSGAEGGLVRVPSLDDCPERPVPRSLPDGLERAAPVRARAEGSRAGDRCAQVLR